MSDTPKLVLQDVYGEMVRNWQRNIEYLDNLEYERPYTDEEKARIHDIVDMGRQYWADQFDLALSKAKGPLKKVLKLHKRDSRNECKGCDYSGYDGEPPEWPCQTVTLICKGTTNHSTQFVWPERPRRERQPRYMTIPIVTRLSSVFGEYKP